MAIGKLPFLALAIAASATGCAGGAAGGILDSATLQHNASARSGNPRVVAAAKSYLYWLPFSYAIGKYELGAKRAKQGEFGAGNGHALAVDNSGFVYEGHGGDPSSPEGVAVLTPTLSTVVRTIDLPNTAPFAITVDQAGSTYVAAIDEASQPEIKVFAAGASGPAKPLRTIRGSRTGLSNGQSIAVDRTGYLYVANPSFQQRVADNIEVFSPGADGNVAPVRVIGGSKTGLTDPQNLVLGADQNIYVTSLSSSGYEVLVFPIKADGDVAPLWTLNSGNYGAGIALGAGGEIYLASSNTPTGKGVAVYAAGASGNDQPISYLPIKMVDAPYKIVLSTPWYQP